MISLGDILDDARGIVHDDYNGTLHVWFGGTTVNVFTFIGTSIGCEVDCWSFEARPESHQEAMGEMREHVASLADGEEY